MADVSMNLSGRVVVGGDGSARDDKFTISASQPICNGSGRVTLRMRPAFRPNISVDKNGVSHNLDVANLSDLSDIDNVDVEVSKDMNLLGRDCNVNAQWSHANRNPAGKVSITTNVDKLGDVTLTMGKRGNNSVEDDDQELNDDVVRISSSLPIADLTGNNDLSARLSYDLVGDVAKANVGYASGDIGAGLESSFNLNNNNMSHKLSVSYSGLEGINIAADVNDKIEGKVRVSKDKYELNVPIRNAGVNVDDVSVRMRWSHDL